MNVVTIAMKIAIRAHAGQFRRDSVTPYVTHPERVVKRVVGDVDAEAVAWLHDVLEDTSETEQSLLDASIPARIVDAVKALTKSPNVEYEEYIAGVKGNPLALKVKVQDMLDNLSDSPTEKQIIKYSRGFLILLERSSQSGE